MTRVLLAFLICVASLPSKGQVIINKYAAVLAHPPCGNVYSVDDATEFAVGDTILVIQMKGATIDSSNTAAFGTILNYNGAGNHEFNVVSAVSGNDISLLYNLKRQYDIPLGRVQFVRVPYFQNYTVSQSHTCMPWNGSKGGIIVLNAAGTVTLNAAIDVSYRGFRNGTLNYANVAPCGKMDYFYVNAAHSFGAEKGEGIAELSQSKRGGRGAQANGGGGGNSHNGGSGGGGNGGAGGVGGKESAQCSAVANGGLGGLAVSYSNSLNKVFLGGGCGAPHANNAHSGSGGPGGGIVMVLANQLVGNSEQIKADGADGVGCPGDCWDAQFGGSAGGSVLLNVGSYTGNVSVSAKGGNGASQGANNTGVGANGPGGGGGGGALWVKGSGIPSQITWTLSGGAKGVFTNTGDGWGTSAGNSGVSLSGLNITFPTDTFKGSTLIVNFRDSIVDCFTRAFILLTPSPAPGMTYQWDFGNGNTSGLANPIFTFPASGTYTVKLTVSDGNGCSGSFSKVVSISLNPGSRKDTSVCAGAHVQLNASGGNTYLWAPPTGLSSVNTASTIASPTSSTTYVVTITAGPGCIYQDTFVVNIAPDVKADFSYTPNPGIPNTPFQLTNESVNGLSYSWSFGDGATSTEENPSHLYKKSGTYKVCLIVRNNEGCSDSVCRNIVADVRFAIGVPSAFSPNNDGSNDVLYVRGSGVESFVLKIFNRWGQKVFETNSMDKGWDGTFKGKAQDMELFAYVLTATFIDGSSKQQMGNISLLR